MELVFSIVIIILIIFIFSSNSSSKNSTPTETDYQRQARLRKEREAIERDINERFAERERQAKFKRQQAEAEQLSRQVELNSQIEQRVFAEQQKQPGKIKKLNRQVVTYKTNWEDFQQVLQQNGVIKFYHFTDRANLHSIINNGGLYSWWKAKELGIEVSMPGGIGYGRELDQQYQLENYVRLCFTKEHPMLYIAQRDGRIKDPVILEIKLDIAYLRETRFSNMNATKTGHKEGPSLADLERIRFDIVLQANHFNISASEKHFYQAEILVLEKIPLEYITNINNV